jgi:hypothetical protein
MLNWASQKAAKNLELGNSQRSLLYKDLISRDSLAAQLQASGILAETTARTFNQDLSLWNDAPEDIASGTFHQGFGGFVHWPRRGYFDAIASLGKMQPGRKGMEVIQLPGQLLPKPEQPCDYMEVRDTHLIENLPGAPVYKDSWQLKSALKDQPRILKVDDQVGYLPKGVKVMRYQELPRRSAKEGNVSRIVLETDVDQEEGHILPRSSVLMIMSVFLKERVHRYCNRISTP